MINGKCPTWFVVKWLEKHPSHTAKAPDDSLLSESAAGAFIDKRFDRVFVSISVWQRSDWTIYNEHGKRVMFRKRTELRKVGDLGARERLTAHTGE